MITVSSNIQQKINVSCEAEEVSINIIEDEREAKLFVGLLPEVTVTDPALAAKIIELEKSGWVYFINTTHTQQNPLEFNANEEFDLPLINDSALITNAPQDLIDYIRNNKLQPSNEGDFGIIRFEFDLNTDLATRKGKLNFDIQAPTRFNHSRFWGSESADNIEPVSIPVPYFVGSTFVQNGATVKTTVDGAGDLYNITVLIGRIIHGKDL